MSKWKFDTRQWKTHPISFTSQWSAQTGQIDKLTPHLQWPAQVLALISNHYKKKYIWSWFNLALDLMEMSVLWSLVLYFLLVGNGVHVEASNHTHRNLQSLPKEQPYRTAYHFQPLKNWMNGLSSQPYIFFSVFITSYVCSINT